MAGFSFSEDPGLLIGFLVKRGKRADQLINVSADSGNDLRRREFEGLLEAMDTCKLKSGLMLTYEHEEKRKIDGKDIRIMPVWKWLLSDVRKVRIVEKYPASPRPKVLSEQSDKLVTNR